MTRREFFWVLVGAAATVAFLYVTKAGALEVTGFRLWDARAQRPISTVIAPGGTLTATNAQRECLAVEIVVDQALQATGPGSIRKTLDGGASTKENQYPYAWEDDGGTPTTFNCAQSLFPTGRHELVVETFSGDDWSGAAGPTARVSIIVEESCIPQAHGFSCPGVGTKLGVGPLEPNAIGATDRKVGAWACCPTFDFVPGAQTTMPDGTVHQLWPVPPPPEIYVAQAWECLNEDVYKARLKDGTYPPGTERCATSAVSTWGYYDAVALPEPDWRAGVFFGAVALFWLRQFRRVFRGR